MKKIMILNDYYNIRKGHKKQSVPDLFKKTFYFFTKGEPELFRNCVIQPLK